MAMRILCTGNCQMSGLAIFLRRALPHCEIRDLPHLATFYEEFSEERIAEDHAWADIVLFHHKHDGAQDYPTKAPKVPMSVWYQSGPFIIQSHEPEHWDVVRMIRDQYGEAHAINVAVEELDMGYTERWKTCHDRMIQKEHDEQVPQELRMSDMMEQGRKFQLQLTCNHPTSLVFLWWTERICKFLGETPDTTALSELECFQNPNIGGLPCEESATSGARKHLGLAWGGRPEDDESGRQVARQRLEAV